MREESKKIKMNRKLKRELIAATVLIILCIFAWVLMSFQKSSLSTQNEEYLSHAVLTLGDEEQIIDLSKDDVYHFESNNIKVHIQVKEKKIAFVKSECKDHICEGYGWLERRGDLAVCLPAKAALSIR